MDKTPVKRTAQKKGTITFRPGSREIEVMEELVDSPIEKIDDSEFVIPGNISAPQIGVVAPGEEIDYRLALAVPSPVKKLSDSEFANPGNASAPKEPVAAPVQELSSLAHLPGALGHVDFGGCQRDLDKHY